MNQIISVLSTILILGIVTGVPTNDGPSNPGLSSWVPMTRHDFHYVCAVLEKKFPDQPQIAQPLDGEKEPTTEGANYLFLFRTPHGRKCCGLLQDGYTVTYNVKCPEHIDTCLSSDFIEQPSGEGK